MNGRRPVACFALDLLYVLGVIVLGPFVLLLRLLRGKKLASPVRRLGLRLGDQALERRSIWIHGVSVGEVLAARGLIEGLRARYPGTPIVVTSTTVTGLATARRTYPNLRVVESPYDLSGAVRRFVKHARPALLVLMELELWPNHLLVARAFAVPVVIANAKLSERSARGYRVLKFFCPGLLSTIDAWCLQNEEYAARVRDLGCPPERLTVTGNLKFDNAKVSDPAGPRSRLLAEHGFTESHSFLIAGSTHDGEERVVLDAFVKLRKSYPSLRLVLAPRHPERVTLVTQLVLRTGVEVGFRSRPGNPPDPQVLLVDTLGELAELYALGDVAFVGGTLVAIGGHNLLEPAAFGVPVVVGPHLRTVRDIAEALKAAGSLCVVEDFAGFVAAVSSLLDNPELRCRSGDAGRRVIQKNQGSVNRALTAIAKLLEEKRIVLEKVEHV